MICDKLRGLADYAETRGAHFQRIEAVSELDDTLRVLDLTQPSRGKSGLTAKW